MSSKIVSKLKHLKNNEFILYHHLGLGDSIVCNGMINYLSKEKGKKIHLPCSTSTYSNLKFLYSKNKNVKVFEINSQIEINDVIKYGDIEGLDILKVGFENRTKGPFNKNFYKQIKIPYRFSFRYFYIPEIEKENLKELELHLKKYYSVSLDYNLIHKESKEVDYTISIKNNYPSIYVEKDTDIFKNIFYYKNLIKNAREVHCVNSSFFHLVERVDTDAKLYFHNNRGGELHFTKKWKIINYDN